MPCPVAGVPCSQLWILKGAPRCFYEAQKFGMVRPKPRREISVILDSKDAQPAALRLSAPSVGDSPGTDTRHGSTDNGSPRERRRMFDGQLLGLKGLVEVLQPASQVG